MTSALVPSTGGTRIAANNAAIENFFTWATMPERNLMLYLHQPKAHVLQVDINLYKLLGSAPIVSSTRYLFAENADLEERRATDFALIIKKNLRNGNHYDEGIRFHVDQGVVGGPMTITIWKESNRHQGIICN